MAKKSSELSPQKMAKARKDAAAILKRIKKNPDPDSFLTEHERDNAAPFYFVLREYIRQLKVLRESAGLTLAQVAEKSGLALESLSRLETGAQTNPTWKTLGLYAVAIGAAPILRPKKPYPS